MIFRYTHFSSLTGDPTDLLKGSDDFSLHTHRGIQPTYEREVMIFRYTLTGGSNRTFRCLDLGPCLSPSSNLSPTGHMTTQNNHKRSRIPMEKVSEVTLKTLRLLWAIWGPFGTIWSQFVAPKSKFLQASHVTTQNYRKGSRILKEMVLQVTLKTFRALFGNFGAIMGPIDAIRGPKMI